MNAASAWARGQRFSEVIKMAEVFEGSLVRAVRRLEELLRQVRAAGGGGGRWLAGAWWRGWRACLLRDVGVCQWVLLQPYMQAAAACCFLTPCPPCNPR